MKRQRKNYTAEEEVAILRRHLLEKMPISDLYGENELHPKDRQEVTELRKSGLKTARAWALKETAMALCSYVYERPARKHFHWWYNWAVRSRLHPNPAIEGRAARTARR